MQAFADEMIPMLTPGTDPQKFLFFALHVSAPQLAVDLCHEGGARHDIDRLERQWPQGGVSRRAAQVKAAARERRGGKQGKQRTAAHGERAQTTMFTRRPGTMMIFFGVAPWVYFCASGLAIACNCGC